MRCFASGREIEPHRAVCTRFAQDLGGCRQPGAVAVIGSMGEDLASMIDRLRPKPLVNRSKTGQEVLEKGILDDLGFFSFPVP